MTLVLPIIVPLCTAVVLLLAPAKPAQQRWIAFTGSFAQLAAALVPFAPQYPLPYFKTDT